MQSKWGEQLKEWEASVEAVVEALKVPAEERLQKMKDEDYSMILNIYI